MKFTKRLGSIFTALLGGAAAVALSPAGQSLLPALGGPAVASGVVLGATLVHVLLNRKAFTVNPDGTPAAQPFVKSTN